MRCLVVLVLLGLLGCREPPDVFHRRDAGGPADVDAAILDPLVARYLAVADRQGSELCRCAEAVHACRRDVEADWTDEGRACLANAIRYDVEGFGASTACLEGAVAQLESCSAGLGCDAGVARSACADHWNEDGAACLVGLGGTAKVLLATCDPDAADAGTP